MDFISAEPSNLTPESNPANSATKIKKLPENQQPN